MGKRIEIACDVDSENKFVCQIKKEGRVTETIRADNFEDISLILSKKLSPEELEGVFDEY